MSNEDIPKEPKGSLSSATEVAQKAADSVLGGQNIGFLASICLLTNNISNPSYFFLPFNYQQSGWLLSTLALVVVWIVSSFSATLLCTAIARIPGNGNFKMRFEFAPAIVYYFGQGRKWMPAVAQLLVCAALYIQSVLSIVTGAQMLDQLLLFAGQKTWGFIYSPHPHWHELLLENASGNSNPFNTNYVISLGFILILLICIPVGFLSLDDNIVFQIFQFFLYIVAVLIFIGFFLITPTIDFQSIPAVGSNSSTILGIVILSFSFSVTVPSWLNEKKPSVSINKSIWLSSGLNLVIYAVTGIVAGWTFPGMTGATSNVLATIGSSPNISMVPRVTSFIFNIATNLPGIPIYSIMIKYNLYVGKVCGKNMSIFWGIFFPFLSAMFVYNLVVFNEVISWASLFINSFACLIVPALLYIQSLRMVREAKLHRKRAHDKKDEKRSIKKIISDFFTWALATDLDKPQVGDVIHQTPSYGSLDTQTFLKNKNENENESVEREREEQTPHGVYYKIKGGEIDFGHVPETPKQKGAIMLSGLVAPDHPESYRRVVQFLPGDVTSEESYFDLDPENSEWAKQSVLEDWRSVDNYFDMAPTPDADHRNPGDVECQDDHPHPPNIRTLPRWVDLSAKKVALCVVFISTVLVVLNIVVDFVMLAEGDNIFA